LHPVLLALVPGMAAMSPITAALLLFIGGAAVLSLAGYIFGAIVFTLSQRKRTV
jgi:MprA protease rhombosortase-interaction domain-containing protein